LDQTDSDAGFVYPSAFSKYLFSGACYVQLGQLYAMVCELGGQQEKLNNPELMQQFSHSWRNYVKQQPGFVFADFLGTDLAEDAVRETTLAGDQRELDKTLLEAFDEFVEALKETEGDGMDFGTFFDIWCVVCDRAYEKLVRTESFSQGLGYAMNFLLSHMAEKPGS